MIQTPSQVSVRALSAGFGHQLTNGLLGLRASSASSVVAVRTFSLAHRNPRQPKTVSQATRRFSFTPSASKEFFPAPDSPSIRETKPAWPHPIYTEEQMHSVAIAHREATTWSDYVSLAFVRALRKCLDFATGYKHDKEVAKGRKSVHDANVPKFAMDEHKYLVRNVFLESVAGVPGMVGGMLRHLRSMRKMKRDNGW